MSEVKCYVSSDEINSLALSMFKKNSDIVEFWDNSIFHDDEKSLEALRYGAIFFTTIINGKAQDKIFMEIDCDGIPRF